MAKRPEPSYKRRKAEDVKKHANQRGGNFDALVEGNFDFYRPKAGENCIRILPAFWENETNSYGHRIFVHFGVGPDKSTYLCAKKMKGEACPVCEAERAAKEAGEEDEAKELSAKKQYLCWVLDRKSDDEVPLLYQMSWTIDQQIQALASMGKGGVIKIDAEEDGFDIYFQKTGEGLKTKYVAFAIDREPSPICESEKKQEKILDYVAEHLPPDILKFYDYDYIAKLISGKAEEKDPDDTEADERPSRKRTRARDAEEEDEDERPSRRRVKSDDAEEDDKPRKRRSRDAEEEEEEDDKPRRRRADPDEEDDKPRRRRSRDAEEEEDDKPRRRRSRDAEEEEEDERPTKSRRGKSEDDEDERPARRRVKSDDAEEEEDEKPRRRRAREEEEEEDDKPKRTRSRGAEEEEEEDEKPRRRRAREEEEEEEEEDERPRRRR